MADRDDEMIEKISAIAGWLSECDLEDYLPVLLENGYNSLAKCIRIDANSLSQMGITNAEHVEKLFGAVNDLKGRGIRGSPSPGSLDPDQMVKDFIDDMEVEKQKQAATVPSIEASDTNTGEEAKVRRRGGTLARQEALKRITMTVMSKALSVDLDALLDDLCKMEEAVKGSEEEDTSTDPGSTEQENKPVVSDIDFYNFLQEMKAHAQSSETDILSANELTGDSVEKLSEDVEAIIREAAAANAEKSEEKEKEFSPKPKGAKQENKKDIDSLSRDERGSTPPTPSQLEVRARLEDTKLLIEKDETLSESERESKLMETKILIAMEKLKEARVQKLVVKVMCPDGSSKMLVVDENKLARDVAAIMIVKLHSDNDPCFCLIERLVDLHLERVLEDHERVVPVLACWPRDNNNSLNFVHRSNKYRLLTRPQDYMPLTHPYATGKDCPFNDNVRRDLILKELFVSHQLPDLQGQLRYMFGLKGKWRKHYFVLRNSGLYYNVKGKSTSILDVVRLVDWRDVEIYSGKEYKKFYKAPTEYCLSLKPIGPVDGTKQHIHHICARSKFDLLAWMQGMRIAKYGTQLRHDYEKTIRLMPWLELEMANDETDGGIAHTPAASSTEDSDELEEEQVDSLTTAASDVKAGEEEVDERNLTLLQRKFRNAWFDNAKESSPVSGFSFEPTPLSPPRTPQPSTMGGVTSVDEEGMFTVRLK